MQCKDIDDDHVIELARRWQQAPRRPSEILGMPVSSAPGVVRALMEEGVPEKLALTKVELLVRRGLLNYGVSPYYCWPA